MQSGARIARVCLPLIERTSLAVNAPIAAISGGNKKQGFLFMIRIRCVPESQFMPMQSGGMDENMITISLCMIVKNEEDVLGRCLDSVQGLVDEIIIVDTGSQDRTIEIAKQYTDRVYPFEWIDDFAAARNYSFSFAQMEYCMWLDADDVISKQDGDALSSLKKTLSPDVFVVMMKYHTAFDQAGNPTFSYYRERLIKNHAGMQWEGAVHEVISPVGEIQYVDCAVSHSKLHVAEPKRNLRIFESQLAKGVRLNAREQFYYGRELYYHQEYTRALEVLEGFLNGGEGWVENQIDACCHCAYCHYALEQPEKALHAYLRSLCFDLPRAEVCCDIGKHFLDRGSYKQAAFWYSIALTCQRDDRRGGFYSPECYDYLPCIQLCVCYSGLGSLEQASRFNELAAAYNPASEAVEHNRAYFAELEKNSI